MALAEVFEAIAGPDAPVEFQAYDGSVAGTPDSPVKVTIRSPIAVSYLAQEPGALGLARAYVSGHLDVDGDMYTALSRLSQAQQTQLGWGERVSLLQNLGGPKLLWPRVTPPPQEVRVNRRWLTGRRHSGDGTPAPSRTTTTFPTRSTSGCSARRWPTPAPAIPRRTPPSSRRRR